VGISFLISQKGNSRWNENWLYLPPEKR